MARALAQGFVAAGLLADRQISAADPSAAAVAEFLPTEPPPPLSTPQPQTAEPSAADQVVAPAVVPEKD